MAAAGIRLHPACRVRSEKFGLLFYDLRGPRLLFAETGALLEPDFFYGNEPVDAFLGGLDKRDKHRVESLVVKLREKGYLSEQ
ncbi:MAG: mycofactocin biosynthesis chaperone MftB [Geobacteraceae bacterium]|jgi:putative mycofactocin binding protein MftB